MTNPQPLEIELKLSLPPHQVEIFLKRMARRRAPPLKQALRTVYFDTPNFSLSAQGVAIRLRQVGRRWLQTLKTEGKRQGGLSRREEYEVPVARGALDWSRFPAEALTHVPEALRAELAPVFETRFNRKAWLLKGRGGAQIEVALDLGKVHAGERSLPICEIELELKAGPQDALFDLALEWAGQFDCLPFDLSKAERGVRLAHGIEVAPVGATPLALNDGMSVEDGFAAIVQACLAQFQANLPGVLASDDIEYVHQARVALRRLRAGLRLTRKVCALPDALMAGLHELAGALGPARDWDVLCAETLPAIAPHYPDADAWQLGLSALDAHRAEVRQAMHTALAEARPGVWLLAMQRWLLQHGWRAAAEAQRFVQLSPLDVWARRALQKGHRPVLRGARDFATLPPAQRHLLRIAIKRQRYAAEFVQSLFGAQSKGHTRRQARYLRTLRDAQDDLGLSNDIRIALGLLTTAKVETGPIGDFVRGWLTAKQVAAANGASAATMRDCRVLKPYW